MADAPDLPTGPVTDPRPAKRPERVVLPGRLVDLVPMDPQSHGESLFQLTCGRDNERLWTYLFRGPFADRNEFDAYLRQLAASEDPVCFAIIERRSGRAVGWATYMRIDPAHRVVEVGNIVFSSALRRTAGATEAIYLMARNAFEALGYRRFEWKCNSLNAASRRAALRFGFTFEGVFGQHMVTKGRSRDTAWFSMLDTEWPKRKEAFEAWLLPSNFDEEGRQKTSLSALNGVA
ncbi:MAG: GNAT family N-acetyltransferase [Nitrososphaerales archaeon]